MSLSNKSAVLIDDLINLINDDSPAEPLNLMCALREGLLAPLYFL